MWTGGWMHRQVHIPGAGNRDSCSLPHEGGVDAALSQPTNVHQSEMDELSQMLENR